MMCSVIMVIVGGDDCGGLGIKFWNEENEGILVMILNHNFVTKKAFVIKVWAMRKHGVVKKVIFSALCAHKYKFLTEI